MRALGAAVLILFSAIAVSAAPRLDIKGSRFTVDGAPRFLVFLSYFDGVRRVAGGLADDLDYLKTRVDGIRVFPNWWEYACPPRSGNDTLFDLNGEIRPAVWRAVDTLISEAGERGLIVDLSFSRESVTDNGSPRQALDPQAYHRALTTIVG